MKERIKEIRKLNKLSQEAFGKRLGVSGAAISRLENGERGVTEQMIISIAREFNVPEEWLRDGSGLRSKPTEVDELIDLQNKYNLDQLDVKILQEYLKLTPEHRKIFKNYFVNVFGGSIASEDEEIVLKVDAFQKELEAEKRFSTSGALQTTVSKKENVS